LHGGELGWISVDLLENETRVVALDFTTSWAGLEPWQSSGGPVSQTNFGPEDSISQLSIVLLNEDFSYNPFWRHTYRCLQSTSESLDVSINGEENQIALGSATGSGGACNMSWEHQGIPLSTFTGETAHFGFFSSNLTGRMENWNFSVGFNDGALGTGSSALYGAAGEFSYIDESASVHFRDISGNVPKVSASVSSDLSFEFEVDEPRLLIFDPVAAETKSVKWSVEAPGASERFMEQQVGDNEGVCTQACEVNSNHVFAAEAGVWRIHLAESVCASVFACANAVVFLPLPERETGV
jgi:hypothetical protein